MRKQGSLHVDAPRILRVGLGVTFIWIGVLILRDPEVWGAMMRPGIAALLSVPVRDTMVATGIFDIVIGTLLLCGILIWQTALVGAAHVIAVLAVTRFEGASVRNIAVLAGLVAAAVQAMPLRIKCRLPGLGTRRERDACVDEDERRGARPDGAA